MVLNRMLYWLALICGNTCLDRCLGLNVPLGVVISADTRGMIEYWSCESLTSPELEDGVELKFRYKTETDLYALAKVGGLVNEGGKKREDMCTDILTLFSI